LLGSFGLRRLRVPIPLQDPALFTSAKTGRQYIASDPLALWKITLRFACENLKLAAYARERPREIRAPTLAMLAGQDPIVQNDRVREFVDCLGHERRRVIEYPGASHTLEFEPDPAAYFRDLAAWCHEIAEQFR
jgi:alpha-beta hydrolase superfamily lysophospholipase